jgi:hypothetical protein
MADIINFNGPPEQKAGDLPTAQQFKMLGDLRHTIIETMEPIMASRFLQPNATHTALQAVAACYVASAQANLRELGLDTALSDLSKEEFIERAANAYQCAVDEIADVDPDNEDTP